MKLVSERIGRTIVFPEPTNEEYRAALQAAGAPPFIADYMIPVYNLIRNGSVAGTTSDLEHILKRRPTALETVLTEDFA